MESFSQTSKTVDFQTVKKSISFGVRNLTHNLNAYECQINNFCETSDQKEEFLKTLWSIIVAFIDLGYGMHPTQRISAPNSGDAEIAKIVGEFIKKAA